MTNSNSHFTFKSIILSTLMLALTACGGSSPAPSANGGGGVTPVNQAGSVSITGTAQVGQELTAAITDANGVTASNVTYEWRRDGTPIAGASANSYTLVAADEGSAITVNVAYTDDDGFSEDVTSSPTASVTGSPPSSAGNFPRGSLGTNDSVPDINCDTIYDNEGTLADDATRTMAAGTTLCLADGTYGDFELDFGGAGTAALPITVAAENPGGAIITGETSVRMSGSYAVLQGLVFKGGQSASSDFLQTRNGSGEDHCSYCRITEIAVIDLQSDNSGKWLNIYGHHNRIDHSWFAGKSNTGALLIINREAPDTGAEFTEVDYIQIDHNYFGDRPPTDGKAYAENTDNDYEAIRTGTSDSHAYDSFSVIEYNYFERIDGEAEVISNKAGNNRISNNTVRDSYGSITLRHGASATVSNNFMLGDGHPFAAGLRIIDDSHRVVNNYIEGARYLSTLFHGGIVVHDSDGSTSNGYQTVENILIAHNTVVNSVNSLNFHGGREDDSPTDIYFVNNIIDDAVGPLIHNTEGGLPINSTYAGNYFDASEFSDDDGLVSAPGFTELDPQLVEDNLGISRPDSSNGPDISAAIVGIGGFDAVDDDIDGQSRSDPTVSGADEDSADPVTTGVLTYDDVGPINYRPEMSRGYVVRIPINNYDFEAGAAGWVYTSSGTITDQPDETFGPGISARIDGAPGRVAQIVGIDPNTNYTLSAFARGPVELGVDLGGAESGAISNNSEYKFETHSFNSGSNTSVTIFADLADEITNFVDVRNGDFTGFSGTTDANWTVFEGAGIGKVQDTSNSASGADGAVKFRWQDADTGGSPSITQVLTNIEPNTEYTLSAYVLDKNDTGVTVTIGVYEGETTNVLESKELVYATLEAANAPEGDDSFLQDSFTFNSASNTTVTLFVIYNSNSSNGAEIRVDDIEMTFVGAPAAGSLGYADEVRIVSHGN